MCEIPVSRLFFAADENYIATDIHSPSIEGIIDALLNTSLINVPIEPEGYYFNVTSLPPSCWQITCKTVDPNISCEIKTQALHVIIFKKNLVSDLRNDIIYSEYMSIICSKIPPKCMCPIYSACDMLPVRFVANATTVEV